MRPPLALAGLVLGLTALAALHVACGPECGPGTYELDGECVPICGPGTVMGEDGRCYEAGDGDADTDADTDVDSDADTDTDVDTDVDSDVDSDSDADGDTDTDADSDGSGDADGRSSECNDAASCAALAADMVGMLNEARVTSGSCAADSLTMNAELVVVAQACVDMMVAEDDVGACVGTLGDRLDAHYTGDYASAGENFAWNRTAEDAIEGLVEDAGTAEHLLNCDFSLVGIAIAPDGDGMMYIAITYVEL